MKQNKQKKAQNQFCWLTTKEGDNAVELGNEREKQNPEISMKQLRRAPSV